MTPVRPAVGRSAERDMFTVLHATHQQADTKAGVLAAALAALTSTADGWSRPAVLLWERGGAAGLLAGGLLAAFVCGLVGGAVSLAAALTPRLLRDPGANRYSFLQLAAASDEQPTDAADAREASASGELSRTVRFLARVAVRKHRWLRAGVACTAVVGVAAGLGVTLLPPLV
ncbi:Pycsar system effector family protein [Streptomyces sp. NPDC048594]|uniref:Pycsar system effector family protein n=1 Tax=unclassified Streptomyces TaxID=2593676 RepID=UPI000F025331|nr:Pycsar system effector family protein [Streptomyces sp. Tu 4128]